MPATKRTNPGKRYGEKRRAPPTRTTIDAEVLRLTLGLSREATDALAREADTNGERCSQVVARAIDEHFRIAPL